MFDALKNENGQSVYPGAAGAFIDDTAAIFDDVAYEALKTPKDPASTPTGTEPPAPAAATEPVIEPAAQPPVIDFDALFKEKTGGKYEKLEDLLTRAEAEPQFANDESKRVFELIKEGKVDEVHDILAMQKLLGNADKLSDADKIKLKIRIENPEWTNEDIEDEYESRFGMDFDEQSLSEDKLKKEKRAVERKIQSEARAAAQYLSDLKKEIVLPDLPKNDKAEYYTQLETRQQEIEKLNDSFIQSIDKEISDFKDIDLSFTDKDVTFEHKFDVKDEEKVQLTEQVKNYWQTFQSRYSKDGQWQTSKLMKDQYILQNFDKIIKSVVTQAQSTKHIDVVKGIANVSDPKPGAYQPDLAAEAHAAAVKKFILA